MGCCSLFSKEKDDEEVQEIDPDHKSNLDGGHLDAKRKCRDLLWLLVFIVFWVGMIIIAGFAFQNGDPRRLIYGTDSWGNLCGVDNPNLVAGVPNSGLDFTNQRLLYYHNPSDSDALRVCVAACPNVDQTCTGTGDCGTGAINVCLTTNGYDNSGEPGAFDCPASVYVSANSLNIRRCVPANAGALLTGFFADINAIDVIEKVFSDFDNTWQRILYSCAIAFGIAFVAIILMRCLVAVIIYTLIILANIALIALAVYFGLQYKEVDDEIKETEAAGFVVLDETKRNRMFFLGLFIATAVIAVIILIISIAMRKRIRLTVAVFEETSKAIFWMPLIYFMPIWTYIFLLIFLAYWVVVYLYLATSKTPVEQLNQRVAFNEETDLKRMWWYHLFGLLWNLQFILACGELVLAGAFTSWYFTRDKKIIGFPLAGSVYRTVRYHLGSLALGSLIIAIIQLVRVILAYIQKKLKNKSSKFVQYALKCLACCLWCFEKCMKFLNKNAYIEIAIFGYSFCTAARQAFWTLLKNAFRVAILNGISLLVMFLIKVFVVGATGLIALSWLRDDPDLHYYSVVVFTIMVFAYFLTDAMLDIYKIGVDSILISFCEDEKRNDGSTAKPYYAPDRFRKFLKKAAKETEGDE